MDIHVIIGNDKAKLYAKNLYLAAKVSAQLTDPTQIENDFNEGVNYIPKNSALVLYNSVVGDIMDTNFDAYINIWEYFELQSLIIYINEIDCDQIFINQITNSKYDINILYNSNEEIINYFPSHVAVSKLTV